MKKTKGKLKGADRKHFNTKENKGKSKKTKAKHGNTKGTSVAFLSHMELTELCRHRAPSPLQGNSLLHWFSEEIVDSERRQKENSDVEVCVTVILHH